MNTFSVGDRVRCVRDYHGFPCKLDANETYVVREVEADDDGEQFVYLEGQGNSAFSSVFDPKAGPDVDCARRAGRWKMACS